MTKQNKGTAWAIGLFVLTTLLGIVVLSSGNYQWGTSDYAIRLMWVFIAAGLVATITKFNN